MSDDGASDGPGWSEQSGRHSEKRQTDIVGMRAFVFYPSPSGPRLPPASYQSHPLVRCPMSVCRRPPMYMLAGRIGETSASGQHEKRRASFALPFPLSFLRLSVALLLPLPRVRATSSPNNDMSESESMSI